MQVLRVLLVDSQSAGSKQLPIKPNDIIYAEFRMKKM